MQSERYDYRVKELQEAAGENFKVYKIYAGYEVKPINKKGRAEMNALHAEIGGTINDTAILLKQTMTHSDYTLWKDRETATKEQQTMNNPFWRINLNLGDRVELHPATDAWMRGNRYGVITKLAKKHVHVKMDKTGRTLRLFPEYVNVID